MSGPVAEFAGSASKLARNPLGIIALFIVLVYAIAATTTAFSVDAPQSERLPLIYFLVVFPVLVLGVFAWLVTNHHTSLYAPSDFKDEQNYITAAQISGAKAAAALTLAEISSDQQVSHGEAASRAVNAVGEAFKLTQKTSADFKECVLWVDDRPENNINLRDALLEFGIDVKIALSTDQALEAISNQRFSAIISDMGRKEGNEEGYVLLKAVRENDKETPFYIYAGSNSEEHRAEAKRRGAQGSTNNANELFREVTKAVLRSSL